MKLIIAGCRSYTDQNAFNAHVDEFLGLHEVDEIVSGGAYGTDYMAEMYALNNNIPLMTFLADWKTHGRAAGPIRNQQMANYADVLLAFWDHKTRGTKSMIDCMKRLNKRYEIIDIRA